MNSRRHRPGQAPLFRLLWGADTAARFGTAAATALLRILLYGINLWPL